MSRSVRTRTLLVAVLTSVLLVACGGGDPGEVTTDGAEGAAEDVEDMEDVDDIDEVAEEAEETLEDAGVDPDAGGSAEVAFRGEMLTVPADEQFGCFVSPDGGSQGAVSFDGTSEDGTSLQMDWAGDSPDSQSVSITTADGSEYQTVFGVQLDVVIDGSSASVNGKIAPIADAGQELDFFVSVDCA